MSLNMNWQAAVSVAATARAMGFESVRIQTDGDRRWVEYRSWLGRHIADSEDREWRRRRLVYRGARRQQEAR